jgi:uncharacterized protein (TIGR03437 family)
MQQSCKIVPLRALPCEYRGYTRNMKWLLALVLLGVAAFGQTPVVSPGGVLNSASFDKTVPVAPGSLISIFGSNLASTTAVADSVPLSTELGNVSVTINGVAAPMHDISHQASFDQLNVQLPFETLPGTAQMIVTNSGRTSASTPIQVGPFSPGIFTIPPGTGNAVAVNNADGSVAAPAGSIPGIATHPAKAGDILIIYADGLGAVTPTIKDGAASTDTVRNTDTKPVVMVGGMAVDVLFSGLSTFVGVNQINIQLPAGTPTGSAVPIQIQVGGLTSPTTATIAVQ